MQDEDIERALEEIGKYRREDGIRLLREITREQRRKQGDEAFRFIRQVAKLKFWLTDNNIGLDDYYRWSHVESRYNE